MQVTAATNTWSPLKVKIMHKIIAVRVVSFDATVCKHIDPAIIPQLKESKNKLQNLFFLPVCDIKREQGIHVPVTSVQRMN